MEKTKNIQSSIIIPKKIQNVAKIIQFFSSTLAMKFAYKLFTTPLKYKTPEREKIMRKSAQSQKVYIDTLEKAVDVMEYGYSKKRVLLVHGWSGRGSQFYMLADKLLEKGYMVVAFDAPGHLDSEGETTNLLEFIEVIKHLWGKYEGFTSAIGHSLGGVALYNIAEILNLKNFVSIGAADKINEIVFRFVESLSLKPKIAEKMLGKIQKDLNYDVSKLSSSVKAKETNAKVLVVHDEQDADVAVHCAENIIKELKNGTKLITNGLGHTRILRDDETANKIVQFIITNTH